MMERRLESLTLAGKAEADGELVKQAAYKEEPAKMYGQFSPYTFPLPSFQPSTLTRFGSYSFRFKLAETRQAQVYRMPRDIRR
jgi:hypothetical protein